jgi:hypothetical protein
VAVLRIRDVFFPDLGSEFSHPGYRVKKNSGSWIRIPITGFKYLFLIQKLIISFKKCDPDLDFTHPGSRGQKGTGSATLMSGLFYCVVRSEIKL